SAEARPFALHERGEHRLRGVEAGDQVGDGRADLHGRAVRIPGDVHDAGLALQDQVVAGPARVRTGPTEAGDAALAHPGLAGAQRLVRQAPLAEGPGPEIVDHDVSSTRERDHRVAAGR